MVEPFRKLGQRVTIAEVSGDPTWLMDLGLVESRVVDLLVR